jgi:formylglycine-generating enzyme required for sulfatase activity
VIQYFSYRLRSSVLIGLLVANPLSLEASETFHVPNRVVEEYPHILKCDTACHKVKSIALSKKNRTKRPECQQCHVGAGKSPFFSPEKIFLPRDSSLMIKPQSTFSLPLKSKNPAPSSLATNKNIRLQEKISHNRSLMTLIPGGEFIMGSNERWDDESPEHIQSVKKFYIDLYEITNAEYKKFTSNTKRETPYHWTNGEIPKNKQNYPVIYVNWYDANEYCKWKGKRLPTEQEWEKAARGESGNIYPWGNTWTMDKSNHPYKGSAGTEPVGSYPNGKSPYGLYDMSGNVWEWVDSFYLPHPGNIINRGEYGEDKRVLKGGSWFDCLSYGCGLSSPTFNRSFFTPGVKNNSFGFRCAKSP